LRARQWDFGDLRKLDGVVLDNCFEAGTPCRDPLAKRRLRLALEASQPFRHLVITFHPRDFFCVEPVSHATAGRA